VIAPELAALTGWIAAAGQITGNLETWTMVYTFDGTGHATREQAISAGFRQFGCDDFNVGRVESGYLAWWGWMDEEHPAEDRAEVAESLGLAGAR
jgi:hypothetical protein